MWSGVCKRAPQSHTGNCYLIELNTNVCIIIYTVQMIYRRSTANVGRINSTTSAIIAAYIEQSYTASNDISFLLRHSTIFSYYDYWMIPRCATLKNILSNTHRAADSWYYTIIEWFRSIHWIIFCENLHYQPSGRRPRGWYCKFGVACKDPEIRVLNFYDWAITGS